MTLTRTPLDIPFARLFAVLGKLNRAFEQPQIMSLTPDCVIWGPPQELWSAGCDEPRVRFEACISTELQRAAVAIKSGTDIGGTEGDNGRAAKRRRMEEGTGAAVSDTITIHGLAGWDALMSSSM